MVIQTISGLACGRPIRGNVAFLGGPLYFLSELRKRFIETLELKDHQVIFPKNSQLYVAIGAALSSLDERVISFRTLLNNIKNCQIDSQEEINRLDEFFINSEEYEKFIQRHKKYVVQRKELASYKGKCFLGIDAGSTTTKMALIDEEGYLLYTYYGSNEGALNPLLKYSKKYIIFYPKKLRLLTLRSLDMERLY